MTLDGDKARTHVRSDNATELRVSPDGRWLAFAERFHVFVLPLVPTGGALDIGPGNAALPLQRVSAEAGEYLHWSGDSKRLHWALGAELFTRSLEEAFAHLDAPPKKDGADLKTSADAEGEAKPEAPATGIAIGFEQPSDVPSGSVAFVGGTIITMKGDEILEDGVVVVRGNRIEAVGKNGEVSIPEDCHRVDVSGRHLLPGIVDVHAHGARAPPWK